MRSAAFFPPGLHPVLDGGVGDKDPMVAPEMPTGGLIECDRADAIDYATFMDFFSSTLS
jgi:hypothetical protein